MQIFDARIQQQENGTRHRLCCDHQVEDARLGNGRRPVSGEPCEATSLRSHAQRVIQRGGDRPEALPSNLAVPPAGRCTDEWVLVPDANRCRADQSRVTTDAETRFRRFLSRQAKHRCTAFLCETFPWLCLMRLPGNMHANSHANRSARCRRNTQYRGRNANDV